MRKTSLAGAIAAGCVLLVSVGGKANGRFAYAASAKEGDERETVRIEQRMPPLDGSNLTATVVEVKYGPGAGSEAHSHACPVIGYVIEGTIESQVQGQPLGRYEAGQTFYEPPNGVHAVSRNGSKDKPARLLAYLLCDKAGPLSTPPKGHAGGGE